MKKLFPKEIEIKDKNIGICGVNTIRNESEVKNGDDKINPVEVKNKRDTAVFSGKKCAATYFYNSLVLSIHVGFMFQYLTYALFYGYSKQPC
jgi:hypothetical protein